MQISCLIRKLKYINGNESNTCNPRVWRLWQLDLIWYLSDKRFYALIPINMSGILSNIDVRSWLEKYEIYYTKNIKRITMALMHLCFMHFVH